MRKEEERLKILIFGLNNSGKTSILLSLKREVNLMDFVSLKPTKGVNVQNIELDNPPRMLNIWEFSGQEAYRRDHLKDFKKYIDHLDKIIYVIDVKDVERYEPALSYLKDIIEQLIKEKITAPITLYLHKFDPNLKFQVNYKNIEDLIKTKLVSKIQEIIPKGLYYEIHKTTIFTIFQKVFVT